MNIDKDHVPHVPGNAVCAQLCLLLGSLDEIDFQFNAETHFRVGSGIAARDRQGRQAKDRFSDEAEGTALKIEGQSLTPEWRVHNATSERDRLRRLGRGVRVRRSTAYALESSAMVAENFAPPLRKPREGRNPNGRRQLAGSVSDGQ